MVMREEGIAGQCQWGVNEIYELAAHMTREALRVNCHTVPRPALPKSQQSKELPRQDLPIVSAIDIRFDLSRTGTQQRRETCMYIDLPRYVISDLPASSSPNLIQLKGSILEWHGSCSRTYTPFILICPYSDSCIISFCLTIRAFTLSVLDCGSHFFIDLILGVEMSRSLGSHPLNLDSWVLNPGSQLGH